MSKPKYSSEIQIMIAEAYLNEESGDRVFKSRLADIKYYETSPIRRFFRVLLF